MSSREFLEAGILHCDLEADATKARRAAYCKELARLNAPVVRFISANDLEAMAAQDVGPMLTKAGHVKT